MDRDFAALEEVLRGPGPFRERAEAAQLLGETGDTRAVEALVDALGDAYASVRSAAAKGLEGFADPRAVLPLVGALERVDLPDVSIDGDARAAAASALGRLGDSRASQPLVKALLDRQAKVREAASRALDRLGWTPDGLDERARFLLAKGDDLAQALGDDPLLAPALLQATKGGEASKRLEVIRALGQIPGDECARELIALMDDPAEAVRVAAVEALGHSSDDRAIPALAGRLADKSEKVRVLAARSLEHLGWKPASVAEWMAYFRATKWCSRLAIPQDGSLVDPLLLQLSKTTGNELRQAVAWLLASTGSLLALEPILRLAEEMTARKEARNAHGFGQALEHLLPIVLPEVADGLLTRIAALEDFSVSVNVYQESGDWSQDADRCDTSRPRMMAGQELGRRAAGRPIEGR